MREVKNIDVLRFNRYIKRIFCIYLNKRIRKRVCDIYEINYEDYQLNLITNNLLESNQYETYIYITDKKDISFMILYKLFKDENESIKYFKYIKNILVYKENGSLVELCISQKWHIYHT